MKQLCSFVTSLSQYEHSSMYMFEGLHLNHFVYK